MSLFRSRRIWLAALTVTVQLSATFVFTIGLCCRAGESAAATMACCKDAGSDHHICPLPKKSKDTQDEAGCSMGSCGPDVQALMALIGPVGLLVSPSSVSFSFGQSSPVPALTAGAPHWISRVESPPPRA